MSDGDYSLPASQSADSLDDRSFSPRIQIRRCFVDHQNLRVAVKGPGDTQSLTFAAGEAVAVLTDNSIQFARQRAYEMIDLPRAQRLPHSLVVDFFLRLFLQGDVAAEARNKLLDYEAHARKQSVPVYWSEQDAADHRLRTLCHLVLTLPEFQLD